MTQHEKIIGYMVRFQKDRYFVPQDFMKPDMEPEYFVGYEASARLSELNTDFPALFDTRRRGKFLERRIRYEAIHEWWDALPKSMQNIFRKRGIWPKGVPVKEEGGGLFAAQ